MYAFVWILLYLVFKEHFIIINLKRLAKVDFENNQTVLEQ